MAAQSLRPRRHPRRAHGIHPRRKTLLQRVHWTSPETMIHLSFCHPDRSGRFSLPFAPRERRPRSGGTLATKPEFIWTSLSMPSLLSVLCALCVLCVNPFLFPLKAQNLDKPVTNIDEEVTAFA